MADSKPDTTERINIRMLRAALSISVEEPQSNLSAFCRPAMWTAAKLQKYSNADPWTFPDASLSLYQESLEPLMDQAFSDHLHQELLGDIQEITGGTIPLLGSQNNLVDKAFFLDSPILDECIQKAYQCATTNTKPPAHLKPRPELQDYLNLFNESKVLPDQHSTCFSWLHDMLESTDQPIVASPRVRATEGWCPTLSVIT